MPNNLPQQPPKDLACPAWCAKRGTHPWNPGEGGLWREHVSAELGTGRAGAVVTQWEDYDSHGGAQRDVEVIMLPHITSRSDGGLAVAEVDPEDADSLVANLAAAKALIAQHSGA